MCNCAKGSDPTRNAKRKSIAGPQRSTVEASQRGPDVRRPASEHERRVYTAVECEIRPRTSGPFAKSKNTSGATGHGRSHPHRRSIDARSQIGTGDCYASRALDSQLRSNERDLERGRVRFVSHQQIRDAM
jgi:hypothetical protein